MIFDKLGGAVVYTIMDMVVGYWQVRVWKEDISKTAFVTHINTYLIILGLVERELQCPDLDNNERIRLRLAHIEFQQLFYTSIMNGPSTVWRDH